MRFLHTADWHLGRVYQNFRCWMTSHTCYQFEDLVRQSKPDAVLIAGDICDRSVPPPYQQYYSSVSTVVPVRQIASARVELAANRIL